MLPARVSTLMLLLQWRTACGTKLVVKIINNSDELRVQKINLHDKCREAGLSFHLFFLIEGLKLTNAKYGAKTPVPEFIDPVFIKKTSPKLSFSMIENKRFGLVFTKTGSSNSGTEYYTYSEVSSFDRILIL